MSNEIKEIEKRVREAARRQKEIERLRKEEIKRISSEEALEEKKKLEEQLVKENNVWDKLFIFLPLIISLIFFAFLLWQIYGVSSVSGVVWERAAVDAEEISDVKIFLTKCLDEVKRKKGVLKYIDPRIPPGWSAGILENFKMAENDICFVKNISIDEQKIGKEPFYIATITNGKEYFRVTVRKDGDKYLIYKVSKKSGEISKEQEIK